MALNFPSNPTPNQIYTGPNGQKWRWNGEAWVSFNEITVVPTASLALAGSGSFSGSFSGSGADLFGIPASGIVGLNLSQISSGSVSASISPATGLQINTNVTAPSFTGSFSGSGANLSGIPASGIVGLNLSQISSGSVSASISPSTGLQVNTNITAPSFSGSFSGSGANLSGIPASGIVGLNLSQIATASFTASVSPTQFSIVSASVTEFAVAGTGVTIGNVLTDTHRVTGSLNISGSLNAPVITGSLFGTASWARNALTASVAVNGTTNDNFQQIFLLMGG